MPLGEQVWQVAEEEGQQQCADVGAVHVCIGQQDDLRQPAQALAGRLLMA